MQTNECKETTHYRNLTEYEFLKLLEMKAQTPLEIAAYAILSEKLYGKR
jgi:hypothetical protein